MKYKRNDGTTISFKTLIDNHQSSVFRHFKGNLYEIITIAQNSENESLMVVYRALYGTNKCYVRSMEMFFSLVDHEKYPDVIQKYRFEMVNK